ncbi:hypothetical protein C4D60_Mb07t13180 [Musa balbisiana]|uniref:Glutathione peroxidase n=1 Tax=Musa balbisiana TaxID=52838 RepID=A0A4S8JEZ5_MUSBA|nr:hypothetical protein C4D60_Mb07t13180 [Musa balbisiana]
MASAAAASSALFYANPTLHAGFQDRRAKTPTAEFLHLSAKFSYGLPTSAFRVLKDPSRLRQNLGSVGRPGRTPGVAYATAATEKRVHDFTVKDIDGKDVSLNKFKGKILLIVNDLRFWPSLAINLGDKNLDQIQKLNSLPVDVNGPNAAPVYQFLKSSAGGFLGDLIKWNFEKFLVDKNGKVVERYPPTTSPFQIEKDIQKLLAA